MDDEGSDSWELYGEREGLKPGDVVVSELLDQPGLVGLGSIWQAPGSLAVTPQADRVSVMIPHYCATAKLASALDYCSRVGAL